MGHVGNTKATMIPTLSAEEAKTAERMMKILTQKLYERGYDAEFGKMGAILREDPENPVQIILNTKGVKEARLIYTDGSKTKAFFDERGLRVLETLLERDPETEEALGYQKLLETIENGDREGKAKSEEKKNWVELIRIAAPKHGLKPEPAHEQNLCGLALHQKLMREGYTQTWIDKQLTEVIKGGEPWEAAWLRDDIGKSLGKTVLESLQKLDPETAESINSKPGDLKRLTKAIWEDAEDCIWLLCRTGGRSNLRTSQMEEALGCLANLIPWLETQTTKMEFEIELDQLHQDQFSGLSDDPVPLSPIGWGILLMEMCCYNPDQMPSKKQIKLLPEKAGLGEKTKILLQNEIIGSKNGAAAQACGVWERGHILALIDKETDYPPIIDEKTNESHLFHASDHLPEEERIAAGARFYDSQIGGDPKGKLEAIRATSKERQKREIIPWKEICVRVSEPEDKQEESLLYFLNLSMSAEALQKTAADQAGPNASESEIAIKETEVRTKICGVWSDVWDREFSRKFKCPPGFPENPKDWWESWKTDVGLMNLEMVAGKELFKMLKPKLPESCRCSGSTGAFLRKLSEWENPFYWIKKDFFRAAMETDLPTDLHFKDFQWPLPCGTLFLEEGSLEVAGEPVGSITFVKIEEGEPREGIPYLPTPKPIDEIHLLITSANIIPSTKRGPTKIAGSVSNLGNTIQEACEPNIFEIQTANVIRECIKEINPLDWEAENISPLNFEAEEFARELPRIVAKLNLALSSRPNLIERSPSLETDPEKPETDTPLEKEEIWLPNIIGAEYRMQSQEDLSENPKHRDGKSPRTHFRRGHFRKQAYGKNLAEKKIIWIEPIIVCLKGKRESS